ncbi:unnamed protein product, partial [Angiostrongylus costaricensis]|uniref:G_PROTEIN_RECEP_F1_2 domain-containing protein n=1 Tax=Angiostrongylus costaricensis TaxID=334426 RepID=A0A0R3Q161_ANGCS
PFSYHILGQIASLSLFSVSLAVNAFFIYIVYSKTRQETGAYKYVLILFSFCNMLFSALELVSKPMAIDHILGQIASLSLFSVSLAVNAFFIYIVYSKTRQETGAYKYVLILFSFCNMLFSALELVSKPVRIYL